MKTKTVRKFISFGFLLLLLTSFGCKNAVKIPTPGTKLTSTNPKFTSFIKSLDASDCRALGGCTCYIDGVQSSCSLAFACLDAGWCELVKSE
jgi:hypothetical protein